MALAMVGRHFSIFWTAQEKCMFCVRLHRLLVHSSGPGLSGGLSYLTLSAWRWCISLLCLELTADVSSVLKTKSTGGEQGLSPAIAWVHLQCPSTCLPLQLNGWSEVWTACSVAVSSPSRLLQGNSCNNSSCFASGIKVQDYYKRYHNLNFVLTTYPLEFTASAQNLWSGLLPMIWRSLNIPRTYWRCLQYLLISHQKL